MFRMFKSLAAPKATKAERRSAQPALESLERRDVPTVTLRLGMQGGVRTLFLTGNERSESCFVLPQHQGRIMMLKVITSQAGASIRDMGVRYFRAATVQRIVFRGGEGDDFFENKYTAIPTFAYGEGGYDKLVGGAGADRLDGGAGYDTICGMGGNDVLYGGDGNDRLFGGRGVDVLFGQAGDDYLCGATAEGEKYPFRDALYGNAGSDKFVPTPQARFLDYRPADPEHDLVVDGVFVRY